MLHASPISVAALRLNAPLAPGAAGRCQALWLCYTLTLIYTCFRASRSSTLLQDGYYRNAKVVFGQSCPMPQCTIHGLYQCRSQIWLGQHRQPLGLLADTGGCLGSSPIPGNHPHSARAGHCHSITIYSYLHNKITYLFRHLFPSPIQQATSSHPSTKHSL